MPLSALPFPNIGPDIFSVEIGTFTLTLRWYALAYIIGLLVGWRICVATVKRAALWPASGAPLTPRQIEDLLTWIIIGVIVGGRLGFVMFYQRGFYLANPLEILKVWQGGMSFHGGFAGVTIAALVYGIRQRMPLLSMADLLALATPPGLFLGRIANFINNELWGRPSDMPWAVIFPGDAAQSCPGITDICARHPSQLYEALLEGLLLGFALLFLAWRRGWLRTPGAICGLFLAGYGFARSFVELLRQPDAQFADMNNPIGYVVQFGDWGLTMGQFLSLPMVAAGFGLLWLAQKRSAIGSAS